MYTQTRDTFAGVMEVEFSRPVESIMRCEDFKSNFARRLSNRYISKSPVSTPKQNIALKLHPENIEAHRNVPESIEPCSQLSKSINVEHNVEPVKPSDKATSINSDIRITEVTALNMEVDTLKWQLAQTETNRQMHIALLQQIVTFLNRVKDHIDNQKHETDTTKEVLTARILPRSFNFADLPRSRSVLHVNKTLDFTPSPAKKISTRKISKSISNVNGYKDSSGVWNQSKLSLTSELETTHKISEEITRLITLANTVLSTKLPDLACACTEDLVTVDLNNSNKKEGHIENESVVSLNSVEDNMTNAFILNTICNTDEAFAGVLTNKFIEVKDRESNGFLNSPSPISCGIENDFAGIKVDENKHIVASVKHGSNMSTKSKMSIEKKNEYNLATNFMEDESGFSSMSSFQEIGIPVISIIPPSPCKEVRYMGELSDILNEADNWKSDTLGLEKQTVKVFWV